MPLTKNGHAGYIYDDYNDEEDQFDIEYGYTDYENSYSN